MGGSVVDFWPATQEVWDPDRSLAHAATASPWGFPGSSAIILAHSIYQIPNYINIEA